jgi:putative transposase
LFGLDDLPPLDDTGYNLAKGEKKWSVKKCTAEQIINKLREAEALLSQSETVAAVTRKIGVSDVTYYHWRKEYGGFSVDQAKRLKDLEVESQE